MATTRVTARNGQTGWTPDVNDIVVRDHDLLTTEVDGELLAMSVERGNCYGLNKIATRIWALIDEPRTIDSLCARLVEEFEVDEHTCREQVVELLGKFRDEQLIKFPAG